MKVRVLIATAFLTGCGKSSIPDNGGSNHLSLLGKIVLGSGLVLLTIGVIAAVGPIYLDWINRDRSNG